MTAAPQINEDQESRLRRALEQLEQTGGATAGRLVELARDESSEIHDCFEWRDEVAAERFRMHQARTYIRTVKIHVQRVEASDRRLRIVPPPPAPEAPAPDPVAPALSTELMLGRAKSDLEAFYRKFRALRKTDELQGVFAEIEAVIDVGTSPSAQKTAPKPTIKSRDPGCENLVSRGVIKKGKNVPLPDVLRPENLPMRPPRRKEQG